MRPTIALPRSTFRSNVIRCTRSRHCSRAHRRSTVVRAGLFDFFIPKPATTSNRAAELIDEISELAAPTNGGLNVKPATKNQLIELIDEISEYCPRNPARSGQLYGDWEVLFGTRPQNQGGPVLRSPIGATVFAGQKLRQSFGRDGTFTNTIEYKSLGVVPGYAGQTGTFKINSNDTYSIFIEKQQSGKLLGGVDEKDVDLQRTFRVLYLDDTLRIIEYLKKEQDDVEFEDRNITVFRRVVEDEEEVEEEEEEVMDEPRKKAAAAFALPAFSGSRKEQPGLATIAERQYRSDEERRRTLAEQREAAKAEKERERQRAEEEREAARQRQQEIKALLDELNEDAKSAAAAAKAAQQELRNAERQSSGVLRKADQERSALASLQAQIDAAAEELEEARQAEREADNASKEAQQQIRELQQALRKRR